MSLLHSTYDFRYILKLDIRLVTRLLISALEKREECKAWEMWLSLYPKMTTDTFIPFSEFHKRVIIAPVKPESKEDILKKVFDIIKMQNTG